MAKNTVRGWWRALALLGGVALLPACGDESSVAAGTPGTGSQTPLIWEDTSLGAPVGTPGDTPLIWNDPNNAPPPGAIGVTGQDTRTYYTPDPYVPIDSPYMAHPLMTSTSSNAIISPEQTCWSAMNTYRTQGTINTGGGGGGLPGVGGGGGATIVPMMQMSVPLRLCARGNSKNWATNGGNGDLNPAGDTLLTGTIAPPGRLAKCVIPATGAVQSQVSGPNYDSATAAAQYFIGANANQINNTAIDRIGVGYWLTGADENFWTVIFATDAPL